MRGAIQGGGAWTQLGYEGQVTKAVAVANADIGESKAPQPTIIGCPTRRRGQGPGPEPLPGLEIPLAPYNLFGGAKPGAVLWKKCQ